MTDPTSKHVIVGTAGHIDHGKTTLVHRLTGVDTDRLPEEKRRGITIVLGFAPLVLPSGLRVGVVDVPGHERFVKNMVAGAGGIDIALLVVAADEGVMPQTREHVEICQLLGIRRGVVALTKVDKAGELAELAADDVRSELAGSLFGAAEIIPVSALTGEGIDRLLATLDRLAAEVEPRPTDELAMLPVDRVFSMKGFGSVVTGTLISGSIAVGDAVEVLPRVAGRALGEVARIRGLQVFHDKVERAFAGQRTAVNLAGVELDQLALGQVLLTPGAAEPTRKIAVRLTHLASHGKPIKTGARILFHAGTAQVEAGITLIGRDVLEPGQEAYAHVLLREPIATLPGRRFIARGFDAVEKAGRTIAGGVVLDPHPGRRRRNAPETTALMDALAALVDRGRAGGRFEAALAALVIERGPAGAVIEELARRLGATRAECEAAGTSAKLVQVAARLVSGRALQSLGERVLEIVTRFHEAHPFKLGMSIGEVGSTLGPMVPAEVVERAVDELVKKKKLTRDADGLRRPEHAAAGEGRVKIVGMLEAARLEPPALVELETASGLSGTAFRDLLGTLVKSGEIVHAAQQLYFGRGPFQDARQRILAFIEENGGITTAQAKDLLGISRKFLIPLLETLDKHGTTVRIGEVRKARPGAR